MKVGINVQRDRPTSGGDVGLKKSHQTRRGPKRDQRTQQTRQRCDQKAFRQQLSHQTPPARAHSQPHGNFFAASSSASEQQAGDVRAGNQQDHADGEKKCAAHAQQHESLFGHREHRGGIHGNRGDASRITEVNLAGNHCEISANLFHGYTGLHAPKESEPALRIVGEAIRLPQETTLHHQRHPKLRWHRLATLKAWKGDANDRERNAIERNWLSDDRRVCTERPAPQPITQHHHGSCVARGAFRMGESAADSGSHLQHIKVVAGGERSE